MIYSPENLDKAVNALLEVLHVIAHDGGYTDAEFIVQEIMEIGVEDKTIASMMINGKQ